MKECMSQGSIKTIVFDLVGVLFVVDKGKALRAIGLINIVLYYLKHRKDPFDDSLALLNKMRLEVPGQFQDIVTYKGVYLPLCMLEWQRGKLSSRATMEKVLAYYDRLEEQHYFSSKRQKRTLISLVYIMLDSAIGAEIFKPVSSVEYMIKKLKKNNPYKLYILSNIDKETYEEIVQKYQSFFSLFDGIVTSYETHLLKPDPKIFSYLLDGYKLNPQECCYIDDQKENLATAKELGMMTLLCIKASTLGSLLRQYGLMI